MFWVIGRAPAFVPSCENKKGAGFILRPLLFLIRVISGSRSESPYFLLCLRRRNNANAATPTAPNNA
jgi:hypothetical protein